MKTPKTLRELENIMFSMGVMEYMQAVNENQKLVAATRLKAIVPEGNGNYVVVDSVFTLDHGYESMVFSCDSNGNVTEWSELDADRYDTYEEMEIGHSKLVEKWSKAA